MNTRWIWLVAVVLSLLTAEMVSTEHAETPPVERAQASQAEEARVLVEAAAALAERRGRRAFDDFREEKSQWRSGENYVFINDLTGTVVMHPVQPDLEGQNLYDVQDVDGRLWMREFVQVARAEGSGWVLYRFPKPGEEKPSSKVSFIQKATLPDGQEVMVGSGFYLD
jgi:cytochrome c